MGSVPTYPATELNRIMTSPARARTEPASGGFMRAVMRHHDMDDVDEEVVMMRPEKKITQEDQDAIDGKARKRAMKNLVNSWQERLQLISVITTFFASTEAAMLVNTKPVQGSNDWGNNALKASNASLLGALIVHVYAAVLSFLGAFLLIRYKLKEASREEMLAEGMVHSPLAGSVFKDVERHATQAGMDLGLQQTITNNNGAATSAPERNKREGSYPVEPPIISRNPHVEQVGPFMGKVSSHLLSRTHTLCVFLAAIGFVLAIVGILCYAWASQPREVSIFASMCLGAAFVTMVVLLI
ncbi:hypothetical protein OG21DRAFT_1484297 [Imleria badia]|nr:hypothetical protein OG21DRAFT_1484297 [Imleria badia]